MRRRCPTCETVTTDDARRACPKCGRRLTVDDAEVEAAPPSRPTPADRLDHFTRAYAFAAVVLAVLAAVAWPNTAFLIIVGAGLHLPLLCSFMFVVADAARDLKVMREKEGG